MRKKPKPRVIKDYDRFTEEQKEQIKLLYPMGYSESLIVYTDKEGKLVSALPFETDEIFYLVKMTKSEATRIIEDDEDFDDSGFLKEAAKENYEEKYADFENEELDDDSYDQMDMDMSDEGDINIDDIIDEE